LSQGQVTSMSLQPASFMIIDFRNSARLQIGPTLLDFHFCQMIQSTNKVIPRASCFK